MNDSEHNSLRLIFFALFISQLMFMIVAFITATASVNGPDPMFDTLLYVVPALILAAHLGGRTLFSVMTSKEKITYSDGKTNVNVIRSAYIVRWALTEGPNLLAIIGYMLTANIYFLYFFIGGIALYLTLYPKKNLSEV